MERRRILILCEPGLLAQGLRGLIEADDRFQVLQIVGDAPSAAKIIQELKPDVLLVDQDGSPQELGSLLECTARVILLRQDDNTIHVYRAEKHTQATLQDLYETLIA